MFWKKSIKKEFLKALAAKFANAQKQYDDNVKASRKERKLERIRAKRDSVLRRRDAHLLHLSNKRELLNKHVSSLLG